MTRRRQFLAATAASASAVLAARPIAAQTRQKIRYAYLLDPAYDAVVWAMREGKVKSDLIEVEATGMLIPQLLQATSTKQFDVVMTAVIGLPAAQARGLELRILSAALQGSRNGEGGGVWVRKDSAIRDGAGLKGKTLASYGLRSTGYMYVREALHRRFGLNVALEGGDIRQVEVQAPNLPGALATSQADAAALIHSQAFRALQSGEFVNICETGQILNEIYGPLVSAINVSYPDKLAARPEAFREFNRMLKASVAYALSQRAEVFGTVARQANIDPKFFDWWFDRTTDVPAIFGETQAKAVSTGWRIGQELGMLKAVPEVGSVTWEHALRA